MSNEDTNINNYNNIELLDIIGLNENSTLSSIENKINSLIKSYSLENNNKFAQFFIDAKNKLLNTTRLARGIQSALVLISGKVCFPGRSASTLRKQIAPDIGRIGASTFF